MDWGFWSIKKKLPYQERKNNENPMSRSDLCDFSDAYIVVKGTITVAKKHLLLIMLWILLKIDEQHLVLPLIL